MTRKILTVEHFVTSLARGVLGDVNVDVTLRLHADLVKLLFAIEYAGQTLVEIETKELTDED